MSGGVDSSAAALIIKESGATVFGITMLLYDKTESSITNARTMCKKLNIDHIIYDARETFKKAVIDPFFLYYKTGRTPNPCALCNRDIKFNLLLKFALQQGADFLATGHYATIASQEGIVLLGESQNIGKDQSYFLSLVDRKYLTRIVFPLCQIVEKQQTRKMLKQISTIISQQKESQDICFIKKNYRNYLKINAVKDKGDILHINGTILGQHNGISHYTIGQRKGLGISNKKPLYVVYINYKTKQIFVDESIPIQQSFIVCDVNWLLETNNKFQATIKTRSICLKLRANIEKKPNNKIAIYLLKTNEYYNYSVTGQICTIYTFNNIIIAGGIIE